MNLSFKLRLPFNRLFYCTLVETEYCVGFNSNYRGGDWHFIFMDIDDTNISDLRDELVRQQKKYDLGEMIVTSDKVDSHRVWCFKQVQFKKMIEILCDNKFTNIEFIRWTTRKGCSTMRIGKKKGREEQVIVLKIEGKKNKIPPKIEKVVYETARGKTVKVGNTND